VDVDAQAPRPEPGQARRRRDPVERRIVWEYRGDPPSSFYSRRMGGCQALANGNVLVTAGEQGRVFEVTRAGEIVWDYWSAELDGEQRRRATFYRVHRYPLGWGSFARRVGSSG